MYSPQEAREAEKQLTPEQRHALVGDLVQKKVQDILDQEVLRAIAAHKDRVRIVLTLKECTDSDENIRKFLQWIWYVDIAVSSAFPAWDEPCEGSTTIQFSIPR